MKRHCNSLHMTASTQSATIAVIVSWPMLCSVSTSESERDDIAFNAMKRRRTDLAYSRNCGSLINYYGRYYWRVVSPTEFSEQKTTCASAARLLQRGPYDMAFSRVPRACAASGESRRLVSLNSMVSLSKFGPLISYSGR